MTIEMITVLGLVVVAVILFVTERLPMASDVACGSFPGKEPC